MTEGSADISQRVRSARVASLGLLLLLSSCNYTLNPCADTGRFGTAVCPSHGIALTISPATVTVGKNLSQAFTASGGVAPYSYSVSGVGSITGGVYTSPTRGTANITVTDSAGSTAMSAVTVVGVWSWQAGSSSVAVSETWGTLGLASPANTPGSRTGAYTWFVPSTQTFWLYGGIDSSGNQMQDLWSWNNLEWTWVGGTQLPNTIGSWAALNNASTTNLPGSRNSGATWVDASGNLWLFGGTGIDSTSASGDLDDVWEYIPSAGTWAWQSGSNLANDPGNYGACPGCSPMSREQVPTAWVDPSGNFWLFGGFNTPGAIYLNDFWEFNSTTLTWTLVAGTNTGNNVGLYGTIGTPAGGNLFGARSFASGFSDGFGNLWLFGGMGIDSVGPGAAVLNDMWQYSTTNTTWGWMAGSSTNSGAATYGTVGVSSATNTPMALQSTGFWADSSGNGWMFGGADGSANTYSDLWMWNGAQWAWMNGTATANGTGTNSGVGTAAVANIPPSRSGIYTWTDSSGNFWMYGGNNQAGQGYADVWMYSP